MRFLTIVLVAILALSACNNSSTETVENEVSVNENVVADSKAKLAVEGMMCEVGCVGAIQNELRSTPGVASAVVNFEGSYATIEYDSKLVDENELIAAIEGIGDHAYTAKSFEETEEVEVMESTDGEVVEELTEEASEEAH